jgi:hypothetical protein
MRATEPKVAECPGTAPAVSHAPLDVAALAARLGHDLAVPELRLRLTCAKCGGREVAITRIVDTWPRH